MRAEQIRAHLQRRPFEPIRVFLSDGSHYDVRHPDQAIITPRELVVGLGARNGGMAESVAFCDPVHVTRIEPIAARRSRPRTSGRRRR
jgi:hypothetical protein